MHVIIDSKHWLPIGCCASVASKYSAYMKASLQTQNQEVLVHYQLFTAIKYNMI